MPRVRDLARTVRRGDSEPVHCGAFHVCSSEPLHGNALSTSNAGVRCEVRDEKLLGISHFKANSLTSAMGKLCEIKILP